MLITFTALNILIQNFTVAILCYTVILYGQILCGRTAFRRKTGCLRNAVVASITTSVAEGCETKTCRLEISYKFVKRCAYIKAQFLTNHVAVSIFTVFFVSSTSWKLYRWLGVCHAGAPLPSLSYLVLKWDVVLCFLEVSLFLFVLRN